MKRRSFLSLIGVALAIEPAKLLLAEDPKVEAVAFRLEPGSKYPFMILDSITIEPGQVLNQALFLPPIPKRPFVLDRLGIAFPSELPYPQLVYLFKHLVVEIRADDQDAFSGPANVLPYIHGLLPVPIAFTEGRFSMRITSDEPLTHSGPVRLDARLSGLMEGD